MVRKRIFFLIAFGVFSTFLLTTNYLLVLLNTKESEVKAALSIEEQINFELKRLPETYRTRSLIKNNLTDVFLNFTNIKIDKHKLDLKTVWQDANKILNKNQLYLVNSNLPNILYSLKNAKIIKADLDTRGTQLKFLLTLDGNQHVVFKPKWYDKEKIIEGPVYGGKDRYGSEIVAFYLSIILNKPLTPVSVEREISIKYDLLPVATKELLNTSFQKSNRSCIYGKCFYCKKQDPICEDHNFLLKGAVIFNLNALLKHYRSPWQRTYHKGRKAIWEEKSDYCKFVRTKLTKKRIYDLIDVAIFDFLLQNGDRHHYETFDDNVIYLDNGKGLGNPNIHHIDILAPLYQCCILRRQTWESLLNLSGGLLREKLEKMPNIFNLTTSAHLNAFEERLLIIFATVEYCKNFKKNEHYL